MSKSAELNTYTFKHAELGLMTGIVTPDCKDVVQFRAIPYATIPERLRHSVFRADLDGVNRNFTKSGYMFSRKIEIGVHV